MKSWIINQLEISHGKHDPLKTMEGLRGIAVFLVFFVHYSSLIKPWLTDTIMSVSSFIHSFGNLGVDLFFLLYIYYYQLFFQKKVSFHWSFFRL
jgi:exopolysaccharide production protein ExoZ